MLAHVERYLVGEGVLQLSPVISYLVFVFLGAGSDLSAVATIQTLSITAIETCTFPEAVLFDIALDASLNASQLL
jgi:predicted membrane-bound spermidine synthase